MRSRAGLGVVLLAIVLSACSHAGPVRERKDPRDNIQEGMFSGKEGGFVIYSDKKQAAAGGETPPVSADEYREFQEFQEFRRWKESNRNAPEYREFQDWREWKTYRTWKERAK